MLTESYLYESDRTRKTKHTHKNNKTTPKLVKTTIDTASNCMR